MRFTRNLRGATFFLSHTRISFFFQMSQCHFNFVLIDIKLPHIYTAPKFILSRLISRNQRLRSFFTFFVFSIIRLNLKRFMVYNLLRLKLNVFNNFLYNYMFVNNYVIKCGYLQESRGRVDPDVE